MSLPWSARWWCPRPGAEKMSRLSADQQRALAHAAARGPSARGRCAPRAPRRSRRRRRATRSSVRPTNDSSTSTRVRPGVLGDVREALLRDAEDHELLLVDSVGASPWWWKRGLMPGPLAEVARPGRRAPAQAVVVERGRAQLARERSSSSIAWATSSCVSCSSERSASGASPIVARQPQQDRRQRLVDLVVQVLGDARGAPAPARAAPRGRPRAAPPRAASSMRLKASVSSATSAPTAAASSRACPAARGRPRSSSATSGSIGSSRRAQQQRVQRGSALRDGRGRARAGPSALADVGQAGRARRPRR